MKIGNTLLLMGLAAFLCSAGTGNAAYSQRDRLQLHTADSGIVQQLDKERRNYYTDQLSTHKEKSQLRQEYCEVKTEPEGEMFRHRHQLKKGVSETGGGNKKKKGAGGQNKKGSGGAQKGGGRK